MKKHGLFKTLVIVLLLCIVASYFISSRGNDVSFLAFKDGTASFLAIGDIPINFLQSFYHFFDTVVFILVVGGFYGVLSKVPAYRTLINSIVDKFKDDGDKFVIAMTIVFALISCLTGINLTLFIFIPFVVSIILLMGYDKLVALSATIGGILVGAVGGLFVNFRDPSSYSGVSYTTFEGLLGLENNYVNIIPKILLLVLTIGLLVFYILRHIKKVNKKEVKYDLGEKFELVKSDVKDSTVSLWPLIVFGGIFVKYVTVIISTVIDIPDFSWWIFNYSTICNTLIIIAVVVLIILFGKKKKAIGKVTLAVILTLSLLLVIFGLTPWSGLFDIKFFDDVHKALVSDLTINGFSIYDNIISSNIPGLGDWGSWGIFLIPAVMLILMILVIKFVYSIKLDEILEAFLEGAKKTIPSVFIVVLAYTVLVCTYNNGFLETVIQAADNNVVLQLLISIVGSVISVDLYYTVAAVFNPIVAIITDYSNVMALAFQSLFGLVQLIGPTSLLLIVGLTYFDVPYKSWVKYIWRLILGLFIVIFAVLLIVALV